MITDTSKLKVVRTVVIEPSLAEAIRDSHIPPSDLIERAVMHLLDTGGKGIRFVTRRKRPEGKSKGLWLDEALLARVNAYAKKNQVSEEDVLHFSLCFFLKHQTEVATLDTEPERVPVE